MNKRGAVGLHPWFVPQVRSSRSSELNWVPLAELEKILEDNPKMHVGEIGLDKSFKPPEKFSKTYQYEHQIEAFKAQLSVFHSASILARAFISVYV